MAESSPDPTDRLGAAFRRLVLLTFPSLRFMAVYEYEVISGNAGPNLVARCTDPGLGMPDLPATPLYPGTDGATATWPQGTKFVVGFLNGDPTRPYVIGGDPTQTPIVVSIPASSQVLIAGGASFLIPAGFWSQPVTGLLAVLTTLASNLSAATTFGQVNTAGNSLASSLLGMPPAATTKTKAT